MKSLENKSVGFQINENAQFVEGSTSYADLILGLLDTGTNFSRKELKARDRIEKAIEESVADASITNRLLLFEDADAKHLKGLINDLAWPKRHKDILTFSDDIDNMKPHKNEENE